MNHVRIAYLMSRFPKATETFIVREAVEVEQFGFEVHLLALTRQDDGVVQPEAARFRDRVRFGTNDRRRMVADQVWWLRRRPLRLATTWLEALWGNRRSPRFLLRTVVVVPVAASFARDVVEDGHRWVHAHYATHPALAAYTIGRLADVPFSITAHAHDIYVDRAMLATKLEAARFVATVSEFNRTLLSDLYGPRLAEKIHVVRCGVNPELFAPDGAAGPAPDGPLRIVSVGSLEPYKGHHHLIEACALLEAEGTDLRCTIVGEGPERRNLERAAAELGVASSIEFVGRLGRDEVIATLRGADVFALASVQTAAGKMEGVPVALMEAMSMGLPVVASRLSGIPELVRHERTGLLAEPGDSASLAACLTRLATDDALRSALAAAGREAVCRDYDVRSNGARMAGLFEAGLAAEAQRKTVAA